MKPKLTSETALDMVTRIEGLTEQIDAIYAEARSFDGENNDSVIRDAVKARAHQRDSAWEAEAYIASFDIEDDLEK